MADEDEVPRWDWPTGPAAELVRQKQIELARLITDRTPVFLDMNFWIIVREVASGDEQGATEIALVRALEHGVDSGRIFCPITFDLVEELTKQNDEGRAGTIAAFERLSLDVCMVPHNERTAIEVEALIANAYPGVAPVERPVWTCFAFICGYEDLRPPVEESAIDDALLCEMAAIAWRAPPRVLAENLPWEPGEARIRAQALADRLNEGHALHAHQIDGFETAWRTEVAGVCSMVTRIAENEMRRIAQLAGAEFSASGQAGELIGRMIAKKLENPRHRRSFGSLYVPAVIYAAIRATKQRKLSANDIFDFRHAAAALPYCGAFLTDGPLRTLICGGHTALDKEYGCKVVSTPAAALQLLAELTG